MIKLFLPIKPWNCNIWLLSSRCMVSTQSEGLSWCIWALPFSPPQLPLPSRPQRDPGIKIPENAGACCPVVGSNSWLLSWFDFGWKFIHFDWWIFPPSFGSRSLCLLRHLHRGLVILRPSNRSLLSFGKHQQQQCHFFHHNHHLLNYHQNHN